MMFIQRRTAGRWAAIAALTAWLQRPVSMLGHETEASVDAGVAPSGSNGLPYLDRLGLQLYTVRDQIAKDAAATLAAVAAAGYKQVELMNIDADAVRIAAIARDHGLMVHSGFMDFNAITAPNQPGVLAIDRIIQLAQLIGLRHVVFGYIAADQRDKADKCRQIADRANQAAVKIRRAGMRMCYHNHAFEFAELDEATTAFEIFIHHFDPHHVEFELDVFWAKIGGQDPMAMMRRLAGRISQLHLKDLKAGTPVITNEAEVPVDAFQEIGDGIIDMPAVMRFANEIGVDQCHVEQDQSPAPLESIRQSARFLHSFGTRKSS